jgi:hypothetical protein
MHLRLRYATRKLGRRKAELHLGRTDAILSFV